MRSTQALRQGWSIQQLENETPDIADLSQSAFASGSGWMPADMPAQVHDVLLALGKIPDPHVGKSAAECTWVGEKDWAYAGSFASPGGSGPAFLRFNGLDTLARVYLNQTLIGSFDDMNRRYAVEVRRLLKPAGEQNRLLIIFSSPLRYIRQQEARYGKREGIPAHYYLRKSISDFSNYLGAQPMFPKVGVFDDVILDLPDASWLEDVWVRPFLSADLSRADVHVQIKCSGEPARLDWEVTDPDGQPVASGSCASQSTACDFSLLHPRLWWPRTHGKPELYTFKASLFCSDQLCDQRTIPFGVRRIRQLLEEPGTHEKLFAFEVNGVRIFLKGACLVPMEGMTHCWPSERAMRVLDLAEEAHMNVLRVWGDGEIHADEFYDECDRRGFLLWQDFMFGYGIHPVWASEMARCCRDEARDTIRRLRNHPSIFLWCGGNENLMAWDFAFRQPAGAGRELFDEILPQTCAELDPDRPFHPSSPSLGPVPNWAQEGDWHDYSMLFWSPKASVPLFVSEIGRSSAPDLSSLRRFINEEDLWPAGFDPAIHSSRQSGWPPMWDYRSVPEMWLKTGPVEEFCDPTSAEQLVQNLGVAHGEYLQRRVERFRRGVPDGAEDGSRRCWGNMIWRLNDSWPIIYYSVVDYYLEPKIAYSFIKRAYAPLLVSFERTPDAIHVWVTNDTPQEVSGVLTLQHRRFDGKVLGKLSQEVSVPANTSRRFLDAEPLGAIKIREEFLQAGFNGQVATHLFLGERRLLLPEASLNVGVHENSLEISSTAFARQVSMAMPGVTVAMFEDNHFDLPPGLVKSVKITAPASAKELRVKAFNASEKIFTL